MRPSRPFVMLVFAAACSGGGKNDPPIMVQPDAPAAPMPDAPPMVTCLLAPSMGAITPTQQQAGSNMGQMDPAPVNYFLYADLNQDPMPDYLVIDLYKDYGAFKTGWPTGPITVQLTGEETNYATCGACVLAMTDVTQQGATGDPYIATAGTIELMAVGPMKIKGTVSNLELTHVTIDQSTFESTPHQDGCKSQLGSLAFEATPEMNLATGQTRLRLQFKGDVGPASR